MDRIEHLKMIFTNRINDEHIIKEKLQDPSNYYHYIPSLEGYDSIYGLYNMYIEKKYNEAKQNFYKIGIVSLYMSDKYERRIMDAGINYISYALLSDSKELINRFSTLKNPINHENSLGFQLPNSIQNILLDDYAKLEQNIRNIERFAKLPRYKAYMPVVDVLSGFESKDAMQIKAGLEGLIITHKKRKTDPLISRFLSIDTAGFCKLAWIKGYEIDLHNDLVPQAMMPVKSLEKYESYTFLED